MRGSTRFSYKNRKQKSLYSKFVQEFFKITVEKIGFGHGVFCIDRWFSEENDVNRGERHSQVFLTGGQKICTGQG